MKIEEYRLYFETNLNFLQTVEFFSLQFVQFGNDIGQRTFNTWNDD